MHWTKLKLVVNVSTLNTTPVLRTKSRNNVKWLNLPYKTMDNFSSKRGSMEETPNTSRDHPSSRRNTKVLTSLRFKARTKDKALSSSLGLVVFRARIMPLLRLLLTKERITTNHLTTTSNEWHKAEIIKWPPMPHHSLNSNLPLLLHSPTTNRTRSLWSNWWRKSTKSAGTCSTPPSSQMSEHWLILTPWEQQGRLVNMINNAYLRSSLLWLWSRSSANGWSRTVQESSFQMCSDRCGDRSTKTRHWAPRVTRYATQATWVDTTELTLALSQASSKRQLTRSTTSRSWDSSCVLMKKKLCSSSSRCMSNNSNKSIMANTSREIMHRTPTIFIRLETTRTKIIKRSSNCTLQLCQIARTTSITMVQVGLKTPTMQHTIRGSSHSIETTPGWPHSRDSNSLALILVVRECTILEISTIKLIKVMVTRSRSNIVIVIWCKIRTMLE